MNGMLLAAGLGTRFRPFTDYFPKPAIPLLNVPIGFYNLHVIQQLDVEKVTINTHHLPDILKQTFEKYSDAIGIPCLFSDEVDNILGSGGGIKKAREGLAGTGTFVVANADVVNPFAIKDALEFHHKKQALATLVVMEHPEVGTKYGPVWMNRSKQILGFGKEKPSENSMPYHFVGIHFLDERIFKLLPDGESNILDTYSAAIRNGEKIFGFKKTGIWFDAGTLQDYLHATEALLGVLPKLQHQPFFLSFFRRFWPDFDRRPNLWEGEGCEHLLHLGARFKILMDRNCRIHPSVKVSGFSVFGEGVVVGQDVQLHNVVIGPGVQVGEGQKLSDTLVLR